MDWRDQSRATLPEHAAGEEIRSQPASASKADPVAEQRESKKPSKPVDVLMALASVVGLFHARDGTGYVDINVNGHRETWPIWSTGFRNWLTRRWYENFGDSPRREIFESVQSIIEAKARFDAPEKSVHVRVAGLEGRLYLDLCDERWRAVEIDTEGWRVINDPPVRFRRLAGMRPLPEPVPGGSVTKLRDFLNLRSDEDFVLTVAWLLACFRDRGPYPVLVLSGEQGSAKSTFSAVLRALVDPNAVPLRALPRENRELFISADNAHLLAFDNASGMPGWLSDTLCRLATGGGFAVRRLYTDQDEVLFNAVRPVILNGIEDIVTRPDLADRALFLTLEPIPEDRRKPEAELWAAFDDAQPAILGALLDSVVEGLRRLPETRLDRLPRMADFAIWATACEHALWQSGTFMAAYKGNRDDVIANVIEDDSVASAVRALMTGQTTWKGTASELLDVLVRLAGARKAQSRSWPSNARALSGRLRRAASFLRKVGIEVAFIREGAARTRIIQITRTDPEAGPEVAENVASVASVASAPAGKPRGGNDFTASGGRTQNGQADENGAGTAANVDAADAGSRPTVRDTSLKNREMDGADGADANPAVDSDPDAWDPEMWK